MTVCKDFHIVNWQKYKDILFQLSYDDKNFEKILGSNEEQNFMKFLSLASKEKYLSELDDYFKSIQLPIKFIVLFGTPPNTDPLDGIHKDQYPMEGYDAGDFSINFSVCNDDQSFIVFFDDQQTEICQKNYTHIPLLFRTDIFHSVLNFSNNVRLTASLRFDKTLDQKFYGLIA
jgi:hypothetical protein